MIKRLLNRLYNQLFNNQPWHDSSGAKLVYNDAFIKKLRVDYGAPDLEEERLIALWQARTDYENEEPFLEVVHSGINEDGSLKLKLEWNDAFIRLLRSHGFIDEDENILIQRYLASIAREEALGVTADPLEHPPMERQELSTRLPTSDEIGQMLDSMPPEIVRDMEKQLRRRAQQRGKR